MKQLRKLFAALLIFSVMASAFTSCKDDDDDKEDKKAILTSKSWVLSSSKVSPAITVPGLNFKIEDLMTDMDDCDKDDYTVFKTDGTVEVYPSTLVCEGESSDVDKTGKWEMNADQTTLTITDDGDKFAFKITSITTSKVELTLAFSDYITQMGEEFEEIKDLITIPDGTVVKLVFVAK